MFLTLYLECIHHIVTHIHDNALDLGLDNSSQKQVLAIHHDKMSDWGGNFFHHRVPLSTPSPLMIFLGIAVSG